jgi:hypothetical protein
MISFNFNLSNPWSKRWKNVWSKTYNTPFEHKFLELEVIEDSSIVSLMFRLSTRQSHGGLNMELGLVGYSFNFNFYDNRHWNYELDRYYNYGEE